MVSLKCIPVTLLGDRLAVAVMQSSVASFVHGNMHAHIQAGGMVLVDAFMQDTDEYYNTRLRQRLRME